MTVKEVHSKRDVKDFLVFPRKLYADDPQFVSHLDKDIEAVFDPVSNVRFKNGAAKRWLLLGQEQQILGRIAAFYNRDRNEAGVGFFDVMNDVEAAQLLFSIAEQWVKSNGFDKVLGPINFGERDTYWGLLVEGFSNPSYQENYNFPYYASLFDACGYTSSFEQITSELFPEELDDRELEALLLKSDELGCQVEVKHFRFKEQDQFVEDFVTIYNDAWSKHSFYKPLSVQQVVALFKRMRHVIREDMMWFTYVDGNPAAFYISILEMNEVFRQLNGQLNWWAKLKFLYFKKRLKLQRTRGIVFGVVPAYQGMGIYSKMMVTMLQRFKADPILKQIELSWIGDYNPKMHALLEKVKARKTKLHITYEKHI